jgi:CubicO group peptidase (beta-lactamase class C family)
MRLVDRGALSLDDDVDRWLRSWRVLSTSGMSAAVTLRQLLSHTAGLDVGGFAGYDAVANLPTTVDVLAGRGNSPAVTRVAAPGAEFRYSGGGYTVVQLLIEDVTRLHFAPAMHDLVLSPLGMASSTFAQPLPPSSVSRAARPRFHRRRRHEC